MTRTRWSGIVAALATLTCARVVEAEPNLPIPTEPTLANEPLVMKEPGVVVDVIDAADGRDPFDIHVALGFAFQARWATVARTDTTGAEIETYDYRESSSLLIPSVEVGLYHDFSLFAELPVALSHSHSLTLTSGDRVQADSTFSPSFTGPSRSGPLDLTVGLATDVMNQARNAALPTWFIAGSIHVPVGVAINACTEHPLADQISCADPRDVNRNGKQDAGEPGGIEALTPGTSHGTLGLELRSLVSRRIGYVEPYAGIDARLEIPIGHSVFAQANDAGAAFPPVVLGASIGAMIVPWENREHFGRLTFDVRASVDAHTEGTDASVLFDALGSSASPAVRATPAGGAAFTGLTRVAAYPTGHLSTEATWQSSSYVRLSIGTAAAYEGNHALTLEDPAKATSRASFASGAAGYSERDTFSFALNARGAVMF